MNINATLLIQACNFFITSYLLRRFLFRPALSIIDEENANKTTLSTAINQQTQSLEIREKERLCYWHECKQFFIDHRPTVESQDLFSLNKMIPQHIPAPISDQMINQLTVQTQKTLEEKIKHVH